MPKKINNNNNNFGVGIMKNILVLAFSYSLFFLAVPVTANNCAIALLPVNELIVNVDLALASKDVDLISEMSGDMKVKAENILNACDTCDCDDAYESTESMLENVGDVYLSDSFEEAEEYLKELKANIQLTTTHLKKCDS
jgi:hypothetical protein